MKQKFEDIKLLICEDDKFCDATMNVFTTVIFGGIIAQSLITIT
jgi:hypothetical protein